MFELWFPGRLHRFHLIKGIIKTAYQTVGPFVPPTPTDEDIDEQLRQLEIEDGDEDAEDPDTQYSDYGQEEDEDEEHAEQRERDQQAIIDEREAQAEFESSLPQLCECGKLAQDCEIEHPITLTAPTSAIFGDLVYRHQRATELSPDSDIIVTTASK